MNTSHLDPDPKSTDTASSDVRPSAYPTTVSDSIPMKASSKGASSAGTDRTISIYSGRRGSVVIKYDTRRETQRQETLKRNMQILETRKRTT